MQVVKENILGISFLNEEVDIFLNILDKIKVEMNKASKMGFKKQFEVKELEFINNLIESIYNDK